MGRMLGGAVFDHLDPCALPAASTLSNSSTKSLASRNVFSDLPVFQRYLINTYLECKQL